MTAPAIEIQTVEDIDLTPVCEGKRHAAAPVPADWWVELHDCDEKFACTPCLDHIKSEWDRAFDCYGGGAKCRVCQRRFTELGEVFTREVRLR